MDSYENEMLAYYDKEQLRPRGASAIGKNKNTPKEYNDHARMVENAILSNLTMRKKSIKPSKSIETI